MAKETIEIYNDFVKRVEELDLPSSVDTKPILDVSPPLILTRASWLLLTVVFYNAMDQITGSDYQFSVVPQTRPTHRPCIIACGGVAASPSSWERERVSRVVEVRA